MNTVEPRHSKTSAIWNTRKANKQNNISVFSEFSANDALLVKVKENGS